MTQETTASKRKVDDHEKPKGHPGKAGDGMLSAFLKLVGARGFEPPTPTTPLWCATRLRHAPTTTRQDMTLTDCGTHTTSPTLLMQDGNIQRHPVEKKQERTSGM